MAAMKRALLDYDSYRYLYPPRPERAVPVGVLPFYEKRGWWAQVKKNGTCTMIFARGDEVIFRTRHGDELHKAWTPLAEHVAFFAGRSDAWRVYAAELLHSKTPHIKNRLYIFDILVDDGEHLAGSPFSHRQTLLHARFAPRVPLDDAGLGEYRVTEHITLATSANAGYAALWAQLRDEDEGLVLKHPDTPLRPCFSAAANADWQVKVRRVTKNYTF